MAITAVGTQAGGVTVDNAASATRAFGANVAVGNIVVVVASKGVATHRAFVAGDCTKSTGTATLGTITLDKTVARDDTGGPSGAWLDVGIWSAQVTGAGSLTMAVAGGASTFWVLGTLELNSSLGAIGIGASNSGNAATGAPSSGTITPASFDACLVGGLAVGGTATPTTQTPDATFTQVYEEEAGATHMTGSVIRKIISSGSGVSASWTAPTTIAWAAAVVAYTESGGGGITAAQEAGIWAAMNSGGVIGRVDA